MQLNFNKNLHWYLLLAFLISFVILVFQSEGTAGGADDINHYLHSRYAFENPEFFWDTKAKAVFTIIRAPVGLLGYNALRIFNVLMGLAAAFLTLLTARKLKYDHPLLALFLLVFAPMYTMMMLSGMTEIMFSLFLILGIYLYFKNFSIWSAIVISMLPMVRTEGFVIFPLFILAYMLNRKWKTLPFLLTGFLLFSFLGSFYYDDFFWLITKNAYSGGARDIYGSGELLYYVNRFQAIFGLPFFVLIVLGLLYIPVRFFMGGKENRLAFTSRVLVGFMPFLAYFCAHSYVWWKGQGNSVGETRVMAAVFPSAVLLALFTWNHLIRLLRLKKNTGTVLGLILAVYLVFVPFQIYRIPVQLASQQKLIKEAATWIEDMGYTERKLIYWDPFWWFFLDIDPTERSRIRVGLPDRNDPGKNIFPGSLVLWDAHYGPNEGRTPLERLTDNPDFVEIKVFHPKYPFEVLGGYNYELHLFERVESKGKLERQAILDEVQRKEDALYSLKLLQYEDYEMEGYSRDTSNLSRENPKSGLHSLLVDEDREFVPGLEIPVGDLKHGKRDRLNVRISHRFESYPEGEHLALVMSLSKGEKIQYYKIWEIQPVQLQTWEETVMDLEIPESSSESAVLKVYLWNRGGQKVYLDDFTFSLKELSK